LVPPPALLDLLFATRSPFSLGFCARAALIDFGFSVSLCHGQIFFFMLTVGLGFAFGPYRRR
jgi:hypothetical protein